MVVNREKVQWYCPRGGLTDKIPDDAKFHLHYRGFCLFTYAFIKEEEIKDAILTEIDRMLDRSAS